MASKLTPEWERYVEEIIRYNNDINAILVDCRNMPMSEACAKHGVPYKNFRERLRPYIRSINRIASENNTVSKTISRPKSDPRDYIEAFYEDYVDAEILRCLYPYEMDNNYREAIKFLSKTKQEILARRENRETFQSIGEALGISKQAVEIQEKCAFRQLIKDDSIKHVLLWGTPIEKQPRPKTNRNKPIKELPFTLSEWVFLSENGATDVSSLAGINISPYRERKGVGDNRYGYFIEKIESLGFVVEKGIIKEK